MSAAPASTPTPAVSAPVPPSAPSGPRALERPATAADVHSLHEVIARLAEAVRANTTALVDHTAETRMLNETIRRLAERLPAPSGDGVGR